MATPPHLALFSRAFFPYFCTQALGAFNDNLFKNLVVLVLVYGHIKGNPLSPDFMSNIVGALFIAPFVLFSGIAGLWCQQIDNAYWMRLLKWAELGIMLVAAFGFYQTNTLVLLVCVFLMGLHSALFGPVKYAYLPAHLPSQHLVKANSWVEASTFLAIVLGTLCAGLLLGLKAPPTMLGLTVVAHALLGVAAAYRIPQSNTPSYHTSSNHACLNTTKGQTMITWPTPKALWESTQNARRATQEVQSVHLSVLGISSFWCMGSIVLANLPVLAQQQLCLNETALSWLLALFAIGVAMGSLLANTFSHKRLELGLVPLASLGIGVGLVGLYTSLPSNAACSGELLSFGHSASSLWVGLWLWVCGSFGGLFVVPLYTWVQLRTPSHNMGLVISHNNIQNAVFMVMGALLCLGLFALGSRVEHTLLLALAINTLCCVIIFKIIPEFLFRFAVMVLVRCIYRLRTQGASCIPMQGRAVLVANHVSWIDALVIAATCPRPPVFVMYYKIFQWPILGWFFRSVARAIPIAGKNEDAAMYHAAFARIQIALENDELLCIFPEGAISENGQLAAFKPGLFKALATTPAPLYAVGLSGLWNTIFSKQKQSWQQKLQGLLLSKTLHAHYAAVPSTNNTPESLQQWMRALCTPETI